MSDVLGLSTLFRESAEKDRLLVLAVAAALLYEHAPWELVLALLYIAM